MNNTWSDWFATNRTKIGPSWLQSVEYMYPVYSHIYHYAPPPRTLLEIGCGMGDSARALAIMGYTVKAIDNDVNILDKVTNHPVTIANGGIHFEFGNAFDPPKGFNVATSFGVVEHFSPSDRHTLLRAMTHCASLCAITIPSPLLNNSVQRIMGEHDIPLRRIIYECREAGWHILTSFGWGTHNRHYKLRDSLPPRIWRYLQSRGLFSLSFCVIGTH